MLHFMREIYAIRQSRAEICTRLCGMGLALQMAIVFACTLAARAEDPINEAPLPSSADYTVGQTDVGPGPRVGVIPAGPIDSKGGVISGEGYSAEPSRFHYKLGLTVRGVWDDNIFISNTNRVSDYYFAIEPMITIGFGDIEGRGSDYIRLDYIPSIILYVDHSHDDAVSHLIHLEGMHRFSRLTLTLSQDVDILDGTNLNSTLDTTGQQANLDASTPTRLNLFITRLRANYELTGKMFLTGEFDAYITDYPDFISSETLSGGLYINYIWTPKVTVGIGGTAGYAIVDDPNPDQTFEQANVRFTYQATGKLFFNASAGVEFRQSDSTDHTSPVFELGATYHPFDGTTVSLAGVRRNLPSGFFPAQDFGSTSIVLRVQQRLLQRFYLAVAAGYENDNYFNTASGVSAPRNDNYYFVEPSLDVLITRYWSAGVYYLYRQDFSSIDFFSFYDNQVGVRTTIRF